MLTIVEAWAQLSQCAYHRAILRYVIVYTEYATMETEKIGMREFRENLAGYLESGRPLAITRHGETLGFFIPAQKRSRRAEVEAMRAAAKELDAMISAWGASEDELMREYKEIRRNNREKKRNSK
jgi:antitoxin (DNA-binding transcriptional repressor) of toxin-antitoxin stability system